MELDHFDLTNAADAYWDVNTGYFTVPLNVNAADLSNIISPIWLFMHNKNTSGRWHSVDFQMYSSRTYKLDYCYMAGCDVVSNGFQLTDRLRAAFKDGNTTILADGSGDILSPRLTNLPDEQLVMEYNEDRSNLLVNDLLTFAIRFWKKNENGAHDHTLGTLFGVHCVTWKYHDGTDEGPEGPDFDVTGVTPANFGPDSYSFILCDKFTEEDADKKKKDFTWVVIHELGHQRFGDPDHANDNGKGKHHCVMIHGVITIETLNAVRDDPRFCKGHLQMLFNTIW